MRRKIKTKRHIGVDPQYKSPTVQKFINHLMWEGKKSVARSIIYGAFEEIKRQAKTDNPTVVFEEALKNVTPQLEVRSRRVGGATYQVPREVLPGRASTLAMRWLIQAARTRKGKPMAIKIAEEFIQASKREGSAIKKREDMHRMAEANRAFAHFAW